MKRVSLTKWRRAAIENALIRALEVGIGSQAPDRQDYEKALEWIRGQEGHAKRHAARMRYQRLTAPAIPSKFRRDPQGRIYGAKDKEQANGREHGN